MRPTIVRIKGDTQQMDEHCELCETEIPLANIDPSGRSLSANSLSCCQQLKRAWLPKILDFRKLDYAPTRRPPPSFSTFSLFADNYPPDAIGATSRIVVVRLSVFQSNFYAFDLRSRYRSFYSERSESINWCERIYDSWSCLTLNCVWFNYRTV